MSRKIEKIYRKLVLFTLLLAIQTATSSARWPELELAKRMSNALVTLRRIGAFSKKNYYNSLTLKIMLVCSKIKSINPDNKRPQERKKFSAVY